MKNGSTTRVVEDRLWLTGGVVALIFTLLGTVFGYLKIDTATRGYYSGWLKLAAVGIVGAVVVAAVCLADQYCILGI